MLPLGLGFVCLGLLVYDHFQPVNWLAVAFAAAAMAAVMGRLGLTFSDNVGMLRATRSEALTDALNPANNFFNSTRSRLGVAVSNPGDLPQLPGTVAN